MIFLRGWGKITRYKNLTKRPLRSLGLSLTLILGTVTLAVKSAQNKGQRH